MIYITAIKIIVIIITVLFLLIIIVIIKNKNNDNKYMEALKLQMNYIHFHPQVIIMIKQNHGQSNYFQTQMENEMR